MIKQNLLFLIVAAMLAPVSARAQVAIFEQEGGGYIGVVIRDVTPEDVSELKLEKEAGVYVREVEEDSPAEKAGIAAKDVIIEYGGIPVRSSRQFRRLVLETPPGREVALNLVRDGQTVSKTVRVAERSPRRPGRPFGFRLPERFEDFRFEIPEFYERGRRYIFRSERSRLGIQGMNLNDQMAEFLGVPEKQGVLVLEVHSDSPAEKAGLKAGDVIVSVNGKAVKTLSGLSEELEEGASQRLEIIRDKRKQVVEVTIPRARGRRSPSDSEPVRRL
ncbi:MAG TPA: PDZ domain-containing protein [Acidobacteriota bacterium]|nr:PDZ domain-containing protein [Acidobacteriota bacterium]